MPTETNDRHPLARLEFSSRVRKRAQYEAFEFSLIPGGVRVRNGSYADPENHEYDVAIRDGVPVACTCPADAHFHGACKHRVAVAMRRAVLDAAIRMQAVSSVRCSVTQSESPDRNLDKAGCAHLSKRVRCEIDEP
jgi:hypothetical protein